MADFGWCTSGGVLSDGKGDIAFSTGLEEIMQMVYTRIKASAESWQLYPTLGADLEARIGSTVSSILCTKIQRQMAASISDLLSASAYQIQTLYTGNSISAWVFINNTAVLQVTIDPTSAQVVKL